MLYSSMKVLNKKTCGDAKGFYIGRPGPLGNPFIIGKDGTRKEVIEKYKNWAKNNPEVLKWLPIIKGQNLICWCSPLPCHGDILILMCEGIEND